MALSYNAIYLGNSGVMIDPTENDNLGAVNQTAENAAALVGQSFGGPGNALADDWVSVTSVDLGGSAGVLDMNNSLSNDQLRVNSGAHSGSYTFDGVAVFNGTIIYIDGTTATNVPLIIGQMTNGDLYLFPAPSPGGGGNAALSAGPIQSVKITAMTNNVYAGLTADRSVLSFVTCFVEGTRIATPSGLRRIERLLPGDPVLTADHGAQPVLRISCREVPLALLRQIPGLHPVRFGAGALGPGVPRRPVLLSQQHRVVIRAPEGREVLVPARALSALPGVRVIEPRAGLRYYHLLLPRHEVLSAEAMACESLFAGPIALRGFSPLDLAGLSILHGSGVICPRPARPLLSMQATARLLGSLRCRAKEVIA